LVRIRIGLKPLNFSTFVKPNPKTAVARQNKRNQTRKQLPAVSNEQAQSQCRHGTRNNKPESITTKEKDKSTMRLSQAVYTCTSHIADHKTST
jgi:hypothetical protein